MKYALVTYWKNFNTNFIDELKTFDKIFACEVSAVKLLDLGIYLEKVISDFDSIQYNQKYKNFHKVSPNKDETDTRLMLEYIINNYHFDELVLYNDFCDRIDHSLALLSLYYSYNNLIIKTPNSLIFHLEKNVENVIIKNKEYKYISFISLTKLPLIFIKGLKYEGIYKNICPFSDLLISNEFRDNICKVVFYNKGNILCILSNDI